MGLVEIVAVIAAVASPFFVWLLKASIERSLDRTLHSDLEKLKSSLSVQAEFSKLVAQKRLESLLELWRLSLQVGMDVFHKRGVEFEPIFRHMEAVRTVSILLPEDAVHEVQKLTEALTYLQGKIDEGGPELPAAYQRADAATGELREYLRRVIEHGFPRAAA